MDFIIFFFFFSSRINLEFILFFIASLLFVGIPRCDNRRSASEGAMLQEAGRKCTIDELAVKAL